VERTDVLIIGAGLAGLCSARGLRRPFILLERESTPGGLVRSVHLGGSTYDYTGHLLHLQGSGLEALIEKLLPGVMTPVERRAAIFTHGCFIPYPFQANFHPLPREVVKECLLGYILAREHEWSEPETFEQWAQAMFGEGICRHFMRPYNEKLFRIELAAMTADWVDWSVPRPALETVVDGALGTTTEGLGYNPSFLYPREGGIEVLPQALARGVEGIRYGQEVTAIDPQRRVAAAAGGLEVEYGTLVSTMPLTRLLPMIGKAKPQALQWAAGLRWVNVFNLNLTLERPAPWPWQWLYLPEPEFRCYRVGVSSNISPALAPPGCCTVYAEISYLPGERLDEGRTREEVLDDLRRVGLLGNGVGVINEVALRIDPAYVIHDKFRRDNLAQIHTWLREQGIHSIGRWGRWEYSGMKDAMRQGLDTAEELNAG
jgi:protoporphyrinogen oxidase